MRSCKILTSSLIPYKALCYLYNILKKQNQNNSLNKRTSHSMLVLTPSPLAKNPSLNLSPERGETCSYSIGQSNKELKAPPISGEGLGRGFFGGGLHDALQGEEIIVDPLNYTVDHQRSPDSYRDWLLRLSYKLRWHPHTI